MQLRYFVFNKPYQVICQFSPEGDKRTLAEFGFPKGIYSLGRLDYDSEGLLILSNDKKLNHLLLDPKNKHRRTYHVQVEGIPSNSDLDGLRNGLEIKVKGEIYTTTKSDVQIMENYQIHDRIPPVRFRKNIPTTWLAISLTEGKNRQVRKMTAAIGFPTLRLIRYSIEEIELNALKPGEKIEFSKNSIYKKLNITAS